jgi:hypothetical protein
MTIDVATAGEAAQPHRSYIGRHWRGELSLPEAYWVNGVLIGLPIRAYFAIASSIVTAVPPEDPLAPIWLFILPYLLCQPLFVWQGVGIWRSAGQNIQQGKLGWAWTARVIVLINVVFLVIGLFGYAMEAYSSVAAYNQERTARYTVTRKGHFVVFSGLITTASADKLIAEIDRKDVDRVVVNVSTGGLLRPALRVANAIHQKKTMTVVVLGECDSMCVALLASAEERYIFPTSVIRLHAAFFPGTNEKSTEGSSEVEAWYRTMGIGPELIGKMNAHTGPNDLYEPKITELISNHLVTGIFDPNYLGYRSAADWCFEHASQCTQTGFQNWKQQHKAPR